MTVDDVLAADCNNLQTAVVAVETKVGVDSSAVTTTIDYFLKHASGAYRTHTHDGSSDDGANVPLANTSGTLPVNRGGTNGATATTGFDNLSPLTTLGDIVYHNGTNNIRLAGNITAIRKALAQTGNGSVSAAPAWTSIAEAVTGTYKNLSVTRASVTSVTITADEVCLSDTSNNKAIVYSVNETAVITTSGANGLDTSSEASSTWYYIWLIRKSSDGTLDSLLSTSSTSPTMPSGYDQKCLVSAVRNNSSSDFIDFVQIGSNYWYTAWQTMASGNVGLTPWVSITTSAYVPSGLSNIIKGSVDGNGSTAHVTNDNTVATSTTSDRNKIGVDARNQMVWYTFNIITSDTIYWISNGTCYVYCAGFEVNKL